MMDADNAIRHLAKIPGLALVLCLLLVLVYASLFAALPDRAPLPADAGPALDFPETVAPSADTWSVFTRPDAGGGSQVRVDRVSDGALRELERAVRLAEHLPAATGRDVRFVRGPGAHPAAH